MKMKMNELKMNKRKKKMKNPSIISPTERFSEMNYCNNIVQLSIFMSISLRNFKMKPKHSFSYLSRRKSLVRSSASKKRFFASLFLPQILPRDYFSALGLGQKINPR